jgi:hypothetical protein
MIEVDPKYVGTERYTFIEVEHKGQPVYAVELLKIPYCGIMVVFGRVALVPNEDGVSATLSFDYDIVKHVPGKWTIAEFEEYLGSILEEILERQAQQGELVFAGGTDDENRENRTIELTKQ